MRHPRYPEEYLCRTSMEEREAAPRARVHGAAYVYGKSMGLGGCGFVSVAGKELPLG